MITTLLLRSALACTVLSLSACSTSERRADTRSTGQHPAPRSVDVAPAAEFVYVPALLGRVSPNRIENTAVSNIVLKQNVDLLTHNAVARALHSAGFDVVTQRSATVLSGRIEALNADDARPPYRWTLTIRYFVTERATGRVRYASPQTVHAEAGKLTNRLYVLDDLVQASIRALLADPAFQRALD